MCDIVHQAGLKKCFVKSTWRLRQTMSSSSTVYPLTSTLNLAGGRGVTNGNNAQNDDDIPGGISFGSATVWETEYSPTSTGHDISASALRLGAKVSETEHVDKFEYIRFLADIKLLVEQFNEAQLHGYISNSTFLQYNPSLTFQICTRSNVGPTSMR